MKENFYWFLWSLFSCLSPFEGAQTTSAWLLRPHNPLSVLDSFLLLLMYVAFDGFHNFRRKTSALRGLLRELFLPLLTRAVLTHHQLYQMRLLSPQQGNSRASICSGLVLYVWQTFFQRMLGTYSGHFGQLRICPLSQNWLALVSGFPEV